MTGDGTASPAGQPLSAPDGDDWVDTRLQLHHAVQVMASFGQALLEPEEDDGHRAMQWDPGAHGFRSPEAHGESLRPVRLLLYLEPFKLSIRSGGREQTLPLRGRTLDHLYRWAEAGLGEALGPSPVTLHRPDFEIPAHPVGDDAPFDPDAAVLIALAAWYDEARVLLLEVTDLEPSACAVRVWPHHFDQAIRIEDPLTKSSAKPGGEGSDGVINVGMSPGDAAHPQPYWYVSPWPAPDDPTVPDLSVGGWETEGWLGACLPAETVARWSEGEQRKRVREFLQEATAAARTVLRRESGT